MPRLLLLISTLAVVALSGCAVVSGAGGQVHATARNAVADLSRSLYKYGTDTIDDYARWADAETQRAGTVELIGYEPYEGAVHGEPFGALQFRVSIYRSTYDDPYVACFESEFDYWGVVAENWEDDDAVARDIDCPADAQRIAPPVDTRPVEVVPEGAEALVVEVLTSAPAAASADEIVAEVAERMPLPTGDREVPFEPRAVVAGEDIGFAMGDADDCLLVKRTVEGVTVLNVPSILLQPGELGCTPDTALRPEDQLGPPH